MGLLRELVPKAAVLGTLVNFGNPRAQADVTKVQAAARSLGLEVHVVNAGTERDLNAAFTSLLRSHADVLLIGGDALFFRARSSIAALAARHAIPAIFTSREYAEAGGLMTYGTSQTVSHHHAGIYAGRILKGEKAGGLPVMQPTKFEFVINLKAARALGLAIPPTLLALADEVIE